MADCIVAGKCPKQRRDRTETRKCAVPSSVIRCACLCGNCRVHKAECAHLGSAGRILISHHPSPTLPHEHSSCAGSGLAGGPVAAFATAAAAAVAAAAVAVAAAAVAAAACCKKAVAVILPCIRAIMSTSSPPQFFRAMIRSILRKLALIWAARGASWSGSDLSTRSNEAWFKVEDFNV